MYAMPVAVTFRNVSFSDILLDFSCEIEAGSRALIVTATEEESIAVKRLMAGLLMPEQGSVVVFGITTSESAPDTLMQIRRKMGIIPYHGGLVSNLKMWENIFLPYYYHIGDPQPADDAAAANYLNRLHCNGKHMSFPAHLSVFEKRAAAFTRAAIMQPDIMIYCNTLERISKTERACLAEVINDFHTGKAGRTSIYLSSSADFPVQPDFDYVLYIHPQKSAEADT